MEINKISQRAYKFISGDVSNILVAATLYKKLSIKIQTYNTTKAILYGRSKPGSLNLIHELIFIFLFY